VGNFICIFFSFCFFVSAYLTTRGSFDPWLHTSDKATLRPFDSIR
jgi:hypothetical protein